MSVAALRRSPHVTPTRTLLLSEQKHNRAVTPTTAGVRLLEERRPRSNPRTRTPRRQASENSSRQAQHSTSSLLSMTYSPRRPFHSRSPCLLLCLLLATALEDASALLHRGQLSVSIPSACSVPCLQPSSTCISNHPRQGKPVTRLALPNPSNGDSAKGRIRFSGFDLDRKDQDSSPIDLLFSTLTSDVASIGLGVIGLLVLLVGRLILDADVNEISAERSVEETRVNLLAAFACGAILLNGVSKLDIDSALAEKVQLLGVCQPVPVFKPGVSNGTAPWVLESLLRASPAASVVLLKASTEDTWDIEGYTGVVPKGLDFLEGSDPAARVPDYTPILNRLRRETTESYLPTLQALPGRTEFIYLPSNTQAVLLLPVLTEAGPQVVVALGANQARSFTPRDIAWCQLVANRLA